MSLFDKPDWLSAAPVNLDEPGYFELWSEYVSDDMTAFEKALIGGFCADEPGWIFVAGYQGAIAHTFADEQFNGWTAFAVSEDRSPTNPSPGLTGRRQADAFELKGFKTWVATSRHVRTLIVSFRCADETLFARLAASTPRLSLNHRERPTMLPDLSQGIAEFDGVEVTGDALVSTRLVSEFASIESFYVLVSLLACVWRFQHEADISEQELVSLLQTARELQDNLSDVQAINAFKNDCRELLRQVRQRDLGQRPKWQRDGKLLAGYARPKPN
ncbi:MAG: hypothetical protein AAF541_21815 [Pseudomonadota bacterium]